MVALLFFMVCFFFLRSLSMFPVDLARSSHLELSEGV
jgi:hypothetical protein